MKTNKVIGKGGLMLSVILVAAISFFTFWRNETESMTGSFGICFPSPDEWNLLPVVSWAVAGGILLLLAVGLIILNRYYNFVKSPGYVLPSVFLIMTASVPCFTDQITSSLILAAVNFICLAISFSDYNSPDSTQNVFVIATLLSLGSMVQYAFIFMIPGYMVIWLMFKSFRFRELVAMLMGLVAPYWVGIGLGLIPLENFRLTVPAPLFLGITPSVTQFIILINCGISAFLFLLLTLNNAVKLYAGNTKIRMFNNAFNTLAIICILCMIFDYENLQTYMISFYMAISVQTGNFFALRQIKKGWVVILVLSALYLASYLLITFLPR